MSKARGCAVGTPGRKPPLGLLTLLLLQLLGASRLAWSTPLPRAVLHVGPHKTATSFTQARSCGIRYMLSWAGHVLSCTCHQQARCTSRRFTSAGGLSTEGEKVSVSMRARQASVGPSPAQHT